MNTLTKDQKNSHAKLIYFCASESRLTFTLNFCFAFCCYPALQLGPTKSGPWERVLSLLTFTYKRNRPMQEECLHSNRCMVSQHT